MVSVKTVSVSSPRPTQHHAESSQYITEVVVLSQPVRVLIWTTILFLAAVNAASLTVFAVVYMQNDMHGSLLWVVRTYFLYSESKAFLQTNSTAIAMTYATLCVAFGFVSLRILWRSMASRQARPALPRKKFQFWASISKRWTHVEPLDAHSDLRATRTRSLLARLALAVHQLRSWYKRWKSAVGVRGPHFDLRLLAGEVVEISSQTAAAVSASLSFSNVSLNIVYAVVIFLNCVAASVFLRVFRTSTIKRRIACLVTDIVLDFVWGTLLPIWMYLPIVKIWRDRENIAAYMDAFANSTREVERVLIVSWKLYVISIVPFISSCLSLLKLHSALREVLPGTIHSQQHTHQGPDQSRLPVPNGVLRVSTSTFVRAAHVLFPVYGLIILILTLRANGFFHSLPINSQYGCIHRVYPWFATKESCLSRQFNCTSLGIVGSSSQVEGAMDLFDEESLSDMLIVGCTGFEMPHKIQSFKRLMSIIIKNSTIVEWSEAAMLRGEVFQELSSIQLKGVQFVHDPIGLIGVGPIAPSIEWIYMERVDGSHVLPLVGDHWKDVQYLVCRECGLVSFPDVLYQMPRLILLGLAANNLSAIPDDWTARTNVRLEAVLLDENPGLTELPDSMWRQTSSMWLMSMIASNLSGIPEWVADVASDAFLLVAVATPVCRSPRIHLSERVQPRVVCS